MSGEQPSKTPRERVEEFSERVEEYSRLRGLLPPAPHAERVRGYLSMPPEAYDDLSGDDLAKIHIDLTTFTAKLQEELNFQALKVRRCEHLISKRVDGQLHRFTGHFKTEDKRTAAALADPVAAGYLEVQRNCECFLKRWDWYVQRLDGYAKAISDMRYSKAK